MGFVFVLVLCLFTETLGKGIIKKSKSAVQLRDFFNLLIGDFFTFFIGLSGFLQDYAVTGMPMG